MEAYGKQGVNSGSQILSFYPGITYFDGTNIRNEYGIFYSIQCYIFSILRNDFLYVLAHDKPLKTE
jgi:hypothetical protein